MKRKLILPIFFIGIFTTASFTQHSLFLGSGLNTNFGYFKNTDLVDSQSGLGFQLEGNYEFRKEKLILGISTQTELLNWKDQPDSFFNQPQLNSRILFFNLMPQIDFVIYRKLSFGAGGFYKRLIGKQRFILSTNSWTKRNNHFTTKYDIGFLISSIYRISVFKFGISYMHGFNDITNRFYDLEDTGAIIDDTLASYHRVLQFRFLYKI